MPSPHLNPEPQSAARVLVVDDDPELRQFLVQELAIEGYDWATAASGGQALTKIRNEQWDLVVLDWTLPDFSGVEVCRRMRATQDSTPVLMLTARDDVKERVEALDAGADDYLTKPFSIEELLARVRARLRRKELNQTSGGGVLRLGDLELNPTNHEVWRGAEAVNLTVREFELLHHLLEHSGQVRKRQDILEAVWGPTFVGDDNLLDVYVRYLRRKLEPSGKPTLIQTVRGVGFMAKVGDPKQ